MRIIVSICFLIPYIFSIGVSAQAPESFDEGKRLAVLQGKPILMEFLRPG